MEKKRLFERMLDAGRRKEFLDYRRNRQIKDFRMNQMEAYLESSEYVNDVHRLMEGDYYFSIPEKRRIPKGYTNRKRTVYHFEENEMTLLRMMSFVLHEYEDMIPEEVYSFKKGISAKNFIHKVGFNKKFRNMYVAKTDIVDYGNSIDAGRLICLLEREFGKREPEAFRFFSWLLSRQTYLVNGKVESGNTAALPGIPIHNFFTNLYLTEADSVLIPECEAYARYSDDIIMYSPDREKAEANLKLLLARIHDLGLTHHDDQNKTGVFAPGECYEYLGISFSGQDIDIAESSLNKLKRKMRIRAKRIGLDRKKRFHSPEEKARHLISLNRNTFYGKPGSSNLSWAQWAFPVITKVEGLHQLDLYNQHCIRYVLTGKWSDSQYRVRYSELKALGYESLVRAYYTQKTRKIPAGEEE